MEPKRNYFILIPKNDEMKLEWPVIECRLEWYHTDMVMELDKKKKQQRNEGKEKQIIKKIGKWKMEENIELKIRLGQSIEFQNQQRETAIPVHCLGWEERGTAEVGEGEIKGVEEGGVEEEGLEEKGR